ncbi:MAG: thioredoxin family protein [Balneolaceae bacterium]|nr:thioredoxin family protein [Balneolaceae bacterium]
MTPFRYGPDYYSISPDSDSELVLVYIGASWCGPCHEPVLKKALEEIKVTLAQRAQKEGKVFSVIGIANDQSVQKGWDFYSPPATLMKLLLVKSG